MTTVRPFGEDGATLASVVRGEAADAAVDRAAAAVFALFAAREREFGVGPDVAIEYPDVAAPDAALLRDPVAEIAARVAAQERRGVAIGRAVLLTTFADRLAAPLEAAGWRHTAVDMPAGPDFTGWFEREIAPAGRTLYLEAVDEADPKIRPGFVLELRDAAGRLLGGAAGAVHRRDGTRYAWLGVLAVAAGLPRGTGLRLGAATLAHLRERGVAAVHLGTQTAGPFYARLGFRVVHTVLRDVRVRPARDGGTVASDLVMMERRLP